MVLDDPVPTWIPNVCKIMAFGALCLEVSDHYFTYCLGPGTVEC